jgi:hypothetical protein
MSIAWFGIITNENGMSAIYRRLLDFKKASYRIIGKLRNNDDDMVMIKFLMVFDEPVDFAILTDDRYKDVFNTIIAVEEKSIPHYIDLVKQITFIQSGVDPVSKEYVEDERYYSSEDSLWVDEDEEDDDEEEDEEEEEEIYQELRPITALSYSRNCRTFVMTLLACGLIYLTIENQEEIMEYINKLLL